MKEFRAVENFGMKSHTFESGDLKMVKVRRGKRGHRQSRSLVFRISRSSKPISDDSGIKCSSTDEEASTSVEQTQPAVCQLKIRIPKRAIQGRIQENETNAISSVSVEHPELHSDNKFTAATHKGAFDSRMDIMDSSVDDLNLDEDYLRFDKSILCPSSGGLKTVPKKTPTRIDGTQSNDLRRSSRRIVFRVQKDYKPSFTVKESESHEFPFHSSNNNKHQDILGEKRKRRRKPGARTIECKKRKYARPGRPPKTQLPNPTSLTKTGISGGGHSEKLMLAEPPKNSVWTLVPKELFESEFFKSQLLQARLSKCSEDGSNFVPISFSSPFISSSQTGAQKQVKIPVMSINNTSTNREKMPEGKDPKRPTVIYFKTERKKFDCPRDPRKEFRNSQLQQYNEVSKTQNDMLYLFNKYRMLEDIILKNYYELAGGNLNEAESMLSNYFSNSSDTSAVEKAPAVCDSQANLSISTFNLSASDQTACSTTDGLFLNSELRLDDVDTLSRKLIVQSLQLLFHEEAVLT